MLIIRFSFYIRTRNVFPFIIKRLLNLIYVSIEAHIIIIILYSHAHYLYGRILLYERCSIIARVILLCLQSCTSHVYTGYIYHMLYIIIDFKANGLLLRRDNGHQLSALVQRGQLPRLYRYIDYFRWRIRSLLIVRWLFGAREAIIPVPNRTRRLNIVFMACFLFFFFFIYFWIAFFLRP